MTENALSMQKYRRKEKTILLTKPMLHQKHGAHKFLNCGKKEICDIL